MNPLLEEPHAQADTFIALRHDIHRHPELAFDEHRTSALVADKLHSWGYAVERGLGGTGVVGQLVRGDGPRRLGLRADMDALPIDEATGLDYASCHTGVMHACGHDDHVGHTAMLLAAAQHVAQRGNFYGTLNLIFQPPASSWRCRPSCRAISTRCTWSWSPSARCTPARPTT
jgi:hippurate hydrolase